jgi:hypothetical protein
MRSSVDQFDGALAYARALAANSGNGATMVFERRTASDWSDAPGFILTIYSGRPTSAAALARTALPPIVSIGDVDEAKLGGVPFTLFLNSAGHASAMRGAVLPGTILAGDPGCPSGESGIVLTFSDGRASDTRTIPCNSAVGGAPDGAGTIPP